MTSRLEFGRAPGRRKEKPRSLLLPTVEDFGRKSDPELMYKQSKIMDSRKNHYEPSKLESGLESKTKKPIEN